MHKLYRITSDAREYWQSWDNGNGTHTIQWGALGTSGQTRTVKGKLFRSAGKIIRKEMEAAQALGFEEIDEDDLKMLIIEYPVQDMGDEDDLDRRRELEEHLDQLLTQTGLGYCDGGSIGSGTMEVCCMVIDFEMAKTALSDSLQDTAFSGFTRIYLEE